MIPPFSFDIGDGNTSDVFSYFREFYNVSDPHDAGYITITASSSSSEGSSMRDYVSTIISEPDGFRWCSMNETNPHFTIDFHRNRVDLLAYAIETSATYRFIKQWDLYGVTHNRRVLIDRRENTTTCPSAVYRDCDVESITVFRCSSPGVFSKFIFVGTGPDSHNQSILSMTRIRFYGAINPYISITLRHHNSFLRYAYFCIFLI